MNDITVWHSVLNTSKGHLKREDWIVSFAISLPTRKEHLLRAWGRYLTGEDSSNLQVSFGEPSVIPAHLLEIGL